MSENRTQQSAQSPFDSIRHEEGSFEYWSARELQELLGYDSWHRFVDAIDRAKQACTNSGLEAKYHFYGAVKLIEAGKGAQREIEDYHLTRFACYLVAMNGDPRKPEIANAQRYFAIKTREAELGNASQIAGPQPTQQKSLPSAVLSIDVAHITKQECQQFIFAVRDTWKAFHPDEVTQETLPEKNVVPQQKKKVKQLPVKSSATTQQAVQAQPQEEAWSVPFLFSDIPLTDFEQNVLSVIKTLVLGGVKKGTASVVAQYAWQEFQVQWTSDVINAAVITLAHRGKVDAVVRKAYGGSKPQVVEWTCR